MLDFKKKLKILFLLGILLFTTAPIISIAQSPETNENNIEAEVVSVLEEGYEFIPGTQIEAFNQTLEVKILEGEQIGVITEVQSQFYNFKAGDHLFLDIRENFNEEFDYIVNQPDRKLPLFFLFIFFVAVILSFSFWKGLRSLLSLGISFFIILFFLLPKLLTGASPIITAVLYASLIVALAMYITHGFNRVTHSAFLGTTITLIFVSFLSYVAVLFGKLSGFASHEALYLNLQTGGLLDISGLLLAAIIIGILGILDDVSITQSATVRELYRVNPNLSVKEVYKRALLVGREHVVSLVNTLALAYAGASLPLLLLFSQSDENFLSLINMEIFATEITRTLVGSTGLILAVPLSTIFASFLLKKHKKMLK